jgi:signal transduction histidine kinase
MHQEFITDLFFNKVIETILPGIIATKLISQGTALALSYDIVMTHGGEITVNSNIDEGSIFAIQFPGKE